MTEQHIPGTNPLRRDPKTSKVYFLGKEMKSMDEVVRALAEASKFSPGRTFELHHAEEPEPLTMEVPLTRYRAHVRVDFEFEFDEEVGDDALTPRDQAHELAGLLVDIREGHDSDLRIVSVKEVK